MELKMEQGDETRAEVNRSALVSLIIVISLIVPLGKTELLQGVVVLFLNTAHHKSANNAGDACQNGNTDNRNRNFVSA